MMTFFSEQGRDPTVRLRLGRLRPPSSSYLGRTTMHSVSRFETWAILFTQYCLSLSEDTVVGPFYMVSISYPIHKKWKQIYR